MTSDSVIITAIICITIVALRIIGGWFNKDQIMNDKELKRWVDSLNLNERMILQKFVIRLYGMEMKK